MQSAPNPGLQLSLLAQEHIHYLLELQKRFSGNLAPQKRELELVYEVTNDPFTIEDFQNMISRNECIVLISGDVPYGYMLIDTSSGTIGLKQFNETIDTLIEEDNLDAEVRQLPRFIEVLHPQLYQKEFDEVRWKMLSTLFYYNREKYKGFCFTFFANAETLVEKLKMGWQIAYENGLYYFLVWDISRLDEC